MDMTDEQREALKTKRFLSGMRLLGISIFVAIGLWISVATYESYCSLRWGSAVSSGHHALQKHHYDKAIINLQEALRISHRTHPHQPDYFTHLYLGEAYRCQGKFHQAMAEYHFCIGNPMAQKGMTRAIAHDKIPLF